MMTANDILAFWFEELTPSQWFRGGDAVDHRIRERFESLIEPAYHGEHDDWATSARGRLALILVLDQFPRNLYRGQAKAFAYDDRALALALEGVEQQRDHTLSTHERAFFYLPLEHSECLEIQDRSIERYAALVLETESHDRAAARNYLEFAWKHYAIIKRFGRYPHRNEILDRQPRPEETAFLEGPDSSF